MRSKSVLTLICIAGALLASGCASIRIVTDMKPESNPDLTSPAGVFYIAGLKYSQAGDNQNPYIENRMRAVRSRLLNVARSECATRYPKLFTREQANALPIWVEIAEEDDQHDAKTIGWMLGTLTIFPMVFPAPVQVDRSFTVKVGSWNGRDGIASAPAQQDFRREEHGWITLLTPFALITVPGKSDFPKKSTAFNFNPYMYDDIPELAQQTATAIAKQVATKDAAFWSTPAPLMQIPGMSAPMVSPSEQAPATALPPPTGSSTPY